MNTAPNSRSLGRVKREQRRRVDVVLDGVLICNQRNVFKKFIDGLRIKFNRDAAQLLHVFPTLFAFFRFIININFIIEIIDDAVKEFGNGESR